MTLRIIGAGLGRTGTYSLKLALEELGFGPCYHMEAVARDMAGAVPLWQRATAGQPDFPAIFAGYASAVDWPTAAFFRELDALYPDAKFILTWRDPQKWADSFGATIYTLLQGRDKAPEAVRPWLDMSRDVIARSGFPFGLDETELAARFEAHVAAVRAAIPGERLLEMHISEGWEPLCAFTGVQVPDKPFPETNNREEFWDLVNSAT